MLAEKHISAQPTPTKPPNLAPIKLFFELAYILLLEIVLSDWFLSSSDPYPFAASAATSSAALTGLVVFLWVKPNRSAKSTVLTYFIAAMLPILSVTCLKEHGRLVALTLAITIWLLLSAARFVPDAKSKRLTALLLNCFLLIPLAAVLYLAWSGLFAGVPITELSSHWIGDGLGSYSNTVGATLSASILNEWGSLATIVLALAISSGVAAAGIVFWQATSTKYNAVRVLLAAISIGAIGGLFSEAPSPAPFLTVSTIGGSWLLFLALGGIGAATCRSGDKTDPVAKSLPKRRRKLPKLRLVVVTVAALLIVHITLSNVVRPFADTSQPVSYKSFAPLQTVSQPMQDATISMEDGYFYQNDGFDWAAMHRALRMNIRAGRIVEGGSTITQQLAKNLFLTNDRTIWRKIAEAAYTVELNHYLSKHRIQELYLNTIDYGYGNHGITAAASYYFHETPSELTVAQSAVLVGLVPDPPKPDPAAIAQGEPMYEDLGSLAQGQQTAFGRMSYFFPKRYTDAVVNEAKSVSLQDQIYPYKDAFNRGATDYIPAVWHDVAFYSFADPDQPSDIPNVAPCLKPRLAAFLDDARKKYALTGIDHLGVYNDRGMRQANAVLSAHAYGQAIDISGFRFADGSEISVKDHADPRVLHKLQPLEALLKRHFDIVVDWRDDPIRHQTHFHCEVTGPRPTGQRTTEPVPRSDSSLY